MIGLAVVLAGGLSLPASAQGLSTERLVEFCRDPSSAIWREVGQLVCPSYIRGLIDGARLQAIQTAGSIEDHRAQLRFCMPESASAADAIAVVLRYVEGTPESRREPAAATVYVALAAAWPCNPWSASRSIWSAENLSTDCRRIERLWIRRG